MKCKFCKSENIKNYLKAEKFEIKVCKNCGIAFTYPYPILPQYEEMDFHGTNSGKEKKLLRFDNLPFDWQQSINIEIKMICNNISKDGLITEIGCGEGLFLNELKQLGFKTYGIEPSRSAAERAKDRKLNVEQGYFPEKFPKEKQDLFILSHVFEHIEDPGLFLSNLCTYLKPGGFILFAQTNYKGLIPKIKKEAWYAWVPEHHFWHFTLNGLNRFLEGYGFFSIETEFSSLIHPHDLLYNLAKLKRSLIDQFITLYQFKPV